MDSLQEMRQKERSIVLEAQDESQQRLQETQRLQNTITTIKSNSERQASELQVCSLKLLSLFKEFHYIHQ